MYFFLKFYYFFQFQWLANQLIGALPQPTWLVSLSSCLKFWVCVILMCLTTTENNNKVKEQSIWQPEDETQKLLFFRVGLGVWLSYGDCPFNCLQ